MESNQILQRLRSQRRLEQLRNCILLFVRVSHHPFNVFMSLAPSIRYAPFLLVDEVLPSILL